MKPQHDPWGVTMTRAELRALLACASLDPKDRPRLATVVIKSDGVYATDGAVLAVARFGESLPDRTVVMPSVPLEWLSRSVPKDGAVRITLNGDGDRVKVTVHAFIDVASYKLSDYLFEAHVAVLDDVVPPDYASVLEKHTYEPRHHPHFDVRRLQDLALLGELGLDEAVRSAGYKIGGGAQLQIGSTDDAHPLRVDYPFGQTRWTVLLMPTKDP